MTQTNQMFPKRYLMELGECVGSRMSELKIADVQSSDSVEADSSDEIIILWSLY